jgi:hypothetical protein
VRGRRLLTPSQRSLATRKQLLQPSLVCPTGTRRKIGPIASPGDRHRPLLAGQDVVLRLMSPRHSYLALPGIPRPFLSRRARQARGGRTTRVEHRGFSAITPSWLYTRCGTIGRALRPARGWSKTPPIRHPRTGPPLYRLQTDSTQAPWSSDLAETFHPLLGTDKLGVTAITLFSNSLAPSMYANYDSALRQFFAFCIEENIAPLQATPATMIRYIAWLALLGTVAASSLQPYFSAVNKYFRDHQRQPIAVGELLADAMRGLEMLQPRLVPADTRLPLPAPVTRRPRHSASRQHFTRQPHVVPQQPFPCWSVSKHAWQCASITHFSVARKLERKY